MGIYLNSRACFEVNGPNRVHFLFTIRLSSKFIAKLERRAASREGGGKNLCCWKMIGNTTWCQDKIKIFALTGYSATITTVLAGTLDLFALTVPFQSKLRYRANYFIVTQD